MLFTKYFQISTFETQKRKTLGSSDSKEFACSSGDPGSSPGSGRSSGEGNGNPLQYSCLENSMNRGAWQATVHGVTKSRTQLSYFNFFSFLAPRVWVGPCDWLGHWLVTGRNRSDVCHLWMKALNHWWETSQSSLPFHEWPHSSSNSTGPEVKT